MSKQTAVQILVESMTTSDVSFYSKEIAIALQMEREQIQDAFYHGVDIDAFNVHNKWTEAEKYYKQTHGGKDERNN